MIAERITYISRGLTAEFISSSNPSRSERFYCVRSEKDGSCRHTEDKLYCYDKAYASFIARREIWMRDYATGGNLLWAVFSSRRVDFRIFLAQCGFLFFYDR